MRDCKRFTNLERVALLPMAALLAALAPIVWSVAFLGLVVVVLVPGMLALLLFPMLIAAASPSKDKAPALWRPLAPCRWLWREWLCWPWLCWTALRRSP
jgi:hypothetical protein